MPTSVTVTVVERVIIGKQVQWHDRHDLRRAATGSSFSEIKRAVTKMLREQGLIVLSAGFSSSQALRVLISKKEPAALQLRSNTAGRLG